MNDFNCGSGPSPVSERLTIFSEIIRLTKKKEEKTIVDNFTYQNVRVVELVSILNYIIALYNFGLPIDNLYTLIEVYEEVKTKPGSCYFYLLQYIEATFKSIHPIILMLDHYTKDVYDLLRDEGQMIGKLQFYIMAKAIAAYQVHTQDVIDYLAARLNEYNKELTPKSNSHRSISANSDTTILVHHEDMEDEMTVNIDNDSTKSSNSSIRNEVNSQNGNSKNSIKEESVDEETLFENENPSTPENTVSITNTACSTNTSSTTQATNTNCTRTNKEINSTSNTTVKLELQNEKNMDDEELYNLNIEKKSIIYECLTSLNIYSQFRNIKFNIPSYPSDELIEKIERK